MAIPLVVSARQTRPAPDVSSIDYRGNLSRCRKPGPDEGVLDSQTVSGTVVSTGDRNDAVWAGNANVRGTLARVGGRVMQPAAKMIVGQFFTCLEQKVG